MTVHSKKHGTPAGGPGEVREQVKIKVQQHSNLE